MTPFIFHLHITTDLFYSPCATNTVIMIKLIRTLVTPVLLPSAQLIIIPLSPVHHTEPFKTFLFYPCDDNSSLCFVTYSQPLLIHHTTPFTSNPSSFPCIYTYMSKKKRCLTQRGHDISLTCPSRLIWTFLWSFHGFTRWWACWKGILALRTKEKETNYCLPF